jgi:HD-like signal output (HDOD) protein
LREPEQKLRVCVDRIIENDGVPPFCKHAGDVLTRALDPDSNSTDLARIVLKDLGLSSLLLRVANSARYNRSGRPVMSVSHAIILLGWDTVRNLVSTVRYVEYFASRGAGPREMLILSVISACHSRDIAAVIGYPAPDDAHITGLFRNLGEVVICCHYPREYSSIILKMHDERIDGRAACVRVLGFGWDEVGGRLCEAWNLPPGLIRCVNGSATKAGTFRERSLGSITDYARDLTHALYRHGEGIDSVHLQCVSDVEGRRVLVSLRDLSRIVENARSEARNIFASLDIPTAGLLLERQAERARSVLAATQTFDAGSIAALEAAAETANRALRRGEFDLNAFIGGLLEAVVTAGFDRAIFGLVSEDHASIRGRLASGVVGEDLLPRFQIGTERRADLLVDRARDGRFDDSDLVRTFQPAAFALLPVVVDDKPAGCLYADRADAAPGLDTMLYPLARLRDVIASALRRRSLGPCGARTHA